MDSSFSERNTLPVESLSFKNWWHLLARHTSVVDQNETIHTALKIMVHRGFRHLPVVKHDSNRAGNEILGIVSASDLIDYMENGRLVSGLNNPVSVIMNENPVTICPSDTILDAIRTISEKNVGALLIREEVSKHESKFASTRKKLQGIVTLRDIVSVMAAYVPMGVRVEDYMTRELVTIKELDSISSAVNLMSERMVRRLPVVSGEDQRTVGMITNKMILRYIESVIAYNIRDINVAIAMPLTSIMAAKMPLIDPKEDCGNALYLMRELGTGGFAVVDSRGLLGIITERDLVKRIYDEKGLYFFSQLFLRNRAIPQ
jgi:CBS domain-containing protein